jgi:hypothetical protein
MMWLEYKRVDNWDDGKSYIVCAIDSEFVDEIPNGTLGATKDNKRSPGLRLVHFENGWSAYCKKSEIKYA